MINRNDLEAAIDRLYADRLENDVSLLVEHFADNARLELPGLESGEYLGLSELTGLFEVFVANWRWERWAPLQVIIDGQTVAVNYQLETEFIPTGERYRTQIMDQFIYDQNLKIVHMVQFLDTATFQQLMMKAATD